MRSRGQTPCPRTVGPHLRRIKMPISQNAYQLVRYEIRLHEVYADGFIFVREAKDRWGGIVCYDLRKEKP